jgi:predicted transcriptional regulator
LACGIPVFKGDGSIREWVGTCVDITERTKAEQDLKRAYGQLDDRVRERTSELAKINEELEKEKNHIKVTNNLLELFVQRISLKEYLDAVVHILQQWSGCSCIGIRALDEKRDIPISHMSASVRILKSENFLSAEKTNAPAYGCVTEKAEPRICPS